MIRPQIALVLVWLSLVISEAHPIKVWVELRDKGPNSPSGLSFENAPVYEPYLKALHALGFKSDAILKWQNKISGWVESSRISALAQLPMISSVEELPRKAGRISPPFPKRKAAAPTQAFSENAFTPVFDGVSATALQTELTARGLSPGQGIRIAIIDASFDLGHAGFNHLLQPGVIADQFDFVRRLPQAVTTGFSSSHGALVLSLIGGLSQNFSGLVPNARFLLYRSEDVASETYVEEDYMAEALERAADSGAQVVNISLGYRDGFSDGSPDIPFSALNGHTRPSSIAATKAAQRGILICIAMGNDGPGSKTILAPADAEGVISVGIVNANQFPCLYTSTGPTADGRLKPEIVTIGPNDCTTPAADPLTQNGIAAYAGTSLAAPVITGVTALLRQLHPTLSSEVIRLALMATAGKTLTPNPISGYGLANAEAAHRVLLGNPTAANLKAPWRPFTGSFVTGPTDPRANIPWRKGLNIRSIQVWDMLGQRISVKQGIGRAGFWVEPSLHSRGVYAFRVPTVSF